MAHTYNAGQYHRDCTVPVVRGNSTDMTITVNTGLPKRPALNCVSSEERAGGVTRLKANNHREMVATETGQPYSWEKRVAVNISRRLFSLARIAFSRPLQHVHFLPESVCALPAETTGNDLWEVIVRMSRASCNPQPRLPGFRTSGTSLETIGKSSLKQTSNRCGCSFRNQLASSLPFSNAEAHSCTCTSGILAASCIAGFTIFRASWLLPSDKKMWPSSTREQDVKRFRSSAFAIFRVSRKYRLQTSTRWEWFSLKCACMPPTYSQHCFCQHMKQTSINFSPKHAACLMLAACNNIFRQSTFAWPETVQGVGAQVDLTVLEFGLTASKLVRSISQEKGCRK